MWKSIMFMLFLCGIMGAGIIYLLPHVAPDFSRQGTKVLINGVDTAVIINEEKPSPNWVKERGWGNRPRNVTVRYKDNTGIYHEESFAENEITELEINP